jgi:hypothetical protein
MTNQESRDLDFVISLSSTDILSVGQMGIVPVFLCCSGEQMLKEARIFTTEQARAPRLTLRQESRGSAVILSESEGSRKCGRRHQVGGGPRWRSG